jgi:hypothetical protein
VLCYLRYPGRPLRINERPPTALISFVAEQIAVAHQLSPIGRWIEQRSDLGFGQLLSAHQPCLPDVKIGRPADPGQGVDERAAPDADDAANRGLGCAVVKRSRTRYPWLISAARRNSVLSLSAYATRPLSTKDSDVARKKSFFMRF